MIHVIAAGHHRERLTWRALLDRLPWLGSPPAWRRTVVFAESCCYVLPGVEQHDVNKLGGLSFGGGPHGNSARIGWAYRPDYDDVGLFAYTYANGHRDIKGIGRAAIGEAVEVEISVGAEGVTLCGPLRPGGRNNWVAPMPVSSWGLRLGLFFGGTRAAPHRMEIDLLL